MKRLEVTIEQLEDIIINEYIEVDRRPNFVGCYVGTLLLKHYRKTNKQKPYILLMKYYYNFVKDKYIYKEFE